MVQQVQKGCNAKIDHPGGTLAPSVHKGDTLDKLAIYQRLKEVLWSKLVMSDKEAGWSLVPGSLSIKY